MQISDIKSSLSILQVLALYSLTPDRNNRIRCPFHDDKTPSMQVYPKTNTVFCFSKNCSLHGKAIDQIDFIKYKDNISKHQAILKAKQICSHPSFDQTRQPNISMYHFNELFITLRKQFYRSKKARAYAHQRMLVAEHFEIGYNAYHNKDFKQLKNCIIFPLRDIDHNIVSLYGRSIADKANSAHYYLKDRKGLYPHWPATDTKTLLITEAIIDAATLLSWTNYKVLSLFGTNGWTEAHTNSLSELDGLEEVIFFLDGDEAGQKAVDTYAALIKNIKPDIIISQVQTPQGEDINSLAQSHDDTAEILQHLIQNRTQIHAASTSENNHPFIFSCEKPAASDISTPAGLILDEPDYIRWHHLDLVFTILGGLTFYPVDKLQITLEIKRNNSPHPRHKLRQKIDLYDDDRVEKWSHKIAERLEISSSNILDTLLLFADVLTEYRRSVNDQKRTKSIKSRILSAPQKQAALLFLQKPNLIQRTNDCIGKTGLVGEQINRLILWLVFSSRLRKQPLHVICLGASGTGKTYLQEHIAALIPQDQKYEITAMSDNSVYYFKEEELKNKLVLIEDLDGANEEKVMYALRELMSKAKITKSIVVKDNKGNMQTISLQVKGPICLAGTTTRERLYEDNANRSLLIYLDQSADQKERIMDYQRQLSANLIDRHEQHKMTEFLKDVQTLLKPIRVVNPYATDLKIPQACFKPLRTNSHYLQFIETVTFYHQHQRSVKTDSHGLKYIETTIEDIEIANRLLKNVLLSKSDELSKACRQFFERLKNWLISNHKNSFYRAELRAAFRMNPHNTRYYLHTLYKYGYIKIVGGQKYKQGYEYEITRADEYKKLNDTINNALDACLHKIKSVASVANCCELPLASNSKHTLSTL